jgi:hypothetical protein
MSDELEILSIDVKPPEAVPPEDVEKGVEQRFQVAIRVRNNTSAPLHVWASRRAFDYDPTTKKLILHLSDAPRADQKNPDIEPISRHPRTPRQVAVAAGEEQTIVVPVPTVVRRLEPSSGLGLRIIETPIDSIRDVECQISYATTPYELRSSVNPEQTERELEEWGSVTVASQRISAKSGGSKP